MDLVYIESTIPSYLTSSASRDPVVAEKQRITREWWKSAPTRFELVVSESVIDEIGGGDPTLADQRLRSVQNLRVLDVTSEMLSLAQRYEVDVPIPRKAQTDALHLACAVLGACDFLLTWNCAHLANGIVMRRLALLNARMGLPTPTIVTPEELMEPGREPS